MRTLVGELRHTTSTEGTRLAFLLTHSSIGLLVNFLYFGIEIEVYLIAVEPHLLCLVQNHLTFLVSQYAVS